MDKLLDLKGGQILYNDVRSRIGKANDDIKVLDSGKVGYAEVTDDGYLVLKSSAESSDIIAKLTGFGGGGGGGGSGNNAIISLTNNTGWISTSIINGADCPLMFTWSSLEDDIPTGPGSLTIRVDGITQRSETVEQGSLSVDVAQYLSIGANTVKITVSDIYENTKSLTFRITVTAFSLESKFDSSVAFNNEITFNYTPKGDGDKEMHFLMDGNEFLTKTITAAGRMDTIIIPQWSDKYPEDFKWHGSHLFTCYFNATVEGSVVKSNELRYDLICIDEYDETPIIASDFNTAEVQQYDTLIIPYYVYRTSSSYSDVQLFIDDKQVGELKDVPRNLQTWTYKVSSKEDLTFAIVCGDTRKEFGVRVKAIDIDIAAETRNLVLHLTAEGRSNQESPEKRSIWEYEGIKAELTGFNWNTDGWLKDEKGLSIMRVKDTARIKIPYQPFSTQYTDIKTTGKTIEFEFATSSVFDYDTEIISCFSEGRGFKITAQQALCSSSISSLKTQYKENEHVRISFVISKTANDRIMYCYINGVISGLVQYPATTIFYQNPSVDIKIGSSDAIVDIYRLRIYDNDLSRFQMVNNWIADMQDGQELLNQYQRNNIYDDNDELDLKKVQVNLPTLPYIILDIDGITDKKGNPMGHLPKYKGQKLLVSGSYTDPVEPRNSFSFKNAEIDVQGTSSQAYPIKNFKIKCKPAKTYGTDDQQPTDCSGFIMTYESEKQGKEVCIKKYSMRGYSKYDGKYKDAQALSVPTNTFVFKADYASSEGANNVELVRFYNDNCTYKTPEQTKDGRIRQGIDGFPMIWFGTSGGKTSFIGKYNFNNHKGTDEVYGFSYHGETYEEDKVSDYHRTVIGATDESWEVCDNNSDIALWKRLAGDNQKEILKDKTGAEVTYDKYIVDENLAVVKEICLYPLFDDKYDHSKIEDIDTYIAWQKEWKEKYKDAEDWINQLALLKIHDAGESMDEEIKDQRNFVISLMKADIVEHWELTIEYVQISPIDDMLGEWGKGESAAHAFEVRFPSEWYDAHTEGFPENVRMDRMMKLQKWVLSTDSLKATNEKLETPVTYGDVTYESDTKEYRLAKFRAELGRYFNVDDCIFYYIYTELFLMIDSRVKNSFPTYFAVTHEVPAKHADTGEQLYEETDPEKDVVKEGVDYFKRLGDGKEVPYIYEKFTPQIGAPTVDESGNALFVYLMTEEEDVDKDGWPLGRWCWLPYDMDTAIGINNEGLLVFDYSLEDTEGLKGSEVVPYTDPAGVPVYNGATSVFWNNMRDCFSNEIQKQYSELRTGTFGYNEIEKRYEDHQNMWPAAVFNEDAYYKYILPLIDERHEDRTGMCLGSKEQQRKWWLYNRFRFIDSKYAAGDAFNSTINFRVNNLEGDKTIKITPYADIYVKVKQGEQWQSKPVKTYRNKTTSVFVDVPQAGDTEAYIYSADQLKEVTGLNQSLHISTLDISKAINLQHLDVSAEVRNETLAELSVGANKLLRTISARNCYALGDTTRQRYSETVDLSQCEQLEEAYFDGTLLKTVVLPEGGRLRTVYLPSTITTLNIENQEKITDIQILNNVTHEWDTSNIETLKISNVNSEVQQIAIDIINGLKDGSFVKFTGFDISFDTMAEAKKFIDKLMVLKGIDVPDVATIFGTIHVLDSTAMDYSYYYTVKSKLKDLTIDCQLKKTVKFYDYTGSTLLDQQSTIDNTKEIGHVTYEGEAPTKPTIETAYYKFDGWSKTIGGDKVDDILNNVTTNLTLYAHFEEVPRYKVVFYSYDGVTELQTSYTTVKDRTSVIFMEDFPEAPEGYDAPFVGWGTLKYGSEDIESSDDKRTIINIDHNINAIALMDWEIIDNTINVDVEPNKIDYYAGQKFDPEGMVVSVQKKTPEGQIPAIITVYDYPKERLSSDVRQVEIKLNDTNKCYLTIGMALSMEVVKEPTRPFFWTGEQLDFSGAETLVKFSNDHTELVIDGWIIEPSIIDEPGEAEVTLFYESVSTTYKIVVIQTIDPVLENNDWSLISAISKDGSGDQYWHIGDTRSIEIKDNPGARWNQGILHFRILGFNHNKELESPDRNTITFGLALSKLKGAEISGDLEEVCIGSEAIATIGEDTSYKYSWNKGCNARDFCESFYNSLPEEVRSVIVPVTKGQSDQSWTENPPYQGSTYSDELKTQIDKVFIPSVYELTGLNRIDSSDKRECDESEVCKQYDYYKNSILDESLGKWAQGSGNYTAKSYWTRSFIRDNVLSTGSSYYYYGYIRCTSKVIEGNKPSVTGSVNTMYASEHFGFVPFFNV